MLTVDAEKSEIFLECWNWGFKIICHALYNAITLLLSLSPSLRPMLHARPWTQQHTTPGQPGTDAGLLPAASPVGATALLIVFADDRRPAVCQVMWEQALVSFPTHTVHEIPADTDKTWNCRGTLSYKIAIFLNLAYTYFFYIYYLSRLFEAVERELFPWF